MNSIALAVVLISGGAGFSDVPRDHWAREAVVEVAEAGVMKGYPDGTFRGDRPVTRYELAVALAALAQSLNESWKPLAPSTAPSSQAPPPWAADSLAFLGSRNLLPRDSPVFKNGTRGISSQELADAMASIAATLIEERYPGRREDHAD